MSRPLSRRQVISLSTVTVVGATAGCLGTSEPATFAVYNDLNQEATIPVEIVHADTSETVFDQRWTLAAGVSQSVETPMREAGTYRIRARVEGMYDDSYEWTISENGPPSIHLYVDAFGTALSDGPR
jgi:hypothetical protein